MMHLDTQYETRRQVHAYIYGKQCIFSRGDVKVFVDCVARERMFLMMKGFIRGALIGVGVGLLIAPMTGEELRRQLAERAAKLRTYLPEDANAQLNQYTQQVSERVAQTGSNLKVYAQQAATKVKETGSTLGDLAQKATSDVMQTAQDAVDTAKQKVVSARQSSGAAAIKEPELS
jgi:gas vesicle protein